MSEPEPPQIPQQPPPPPQQPPQQPPIPQQPPPPPHPAAYPAAPSAYPTPYQGGVGPIGEIRSTGICILLFIVTLGFYGWYWYYKTHDEMKRHSGVGIGGGIALLLAILAGIVMPYLTSSEVGELYQRRGQPKPVSAATGLWSFPGALILVGPIIWFVKTNGALNDYWRSLGAR